MSNEVIVKDQVWTRKKSSSDVISGEVTVVHPEDHGVWVRTEFGDVVWSVAWFRSNYDPPCPSIPVGVPTEFWHVVYNDATLSLPLFPTRDSALASCDGSTTAGVVGYVMIPDSWEPKP